MYPVLRTNSAMYTVGILTTLIFLTSHVSSQCTLDSCEDTNTDNSWEYSMTQQMSMLLAAVNTQPKRPFDCSETESRASGVFSIYVDGIRDPVSVYCDHSTDGGRWTVFQRRQNGNVDFHRAWNEYALGFGNSSDEYWLGNEIINAMTRTRKYTLRVDLWDWKAEHRHATYDSFRVASEELQYRLTLGKYSGDAGDALTSVHNGMRFSTFDVDNDKLADSNCAVVHNGGFWFNACDLANLNGAYSFSSVSTHPLREGVEWGSKEWHGQKYSFKKVEMKMRPVK